MSVHTTDPALLVTARRVDRPSELHRLAPGVRPHPAAPPIVPHDGRRRC